MVIVLTALLVVPLRPIPVPAAPTRACFATDARGSATPTRGTSGVARLRLRLTCSVRGVSGLLPSPLFGRTPTSSLRASLQLGGDSHLRLVAFDDAGTTLVAKIMDTRPTTVVIAGNGKFHGPLAWPRVPTLASLDVGRRGVPSSPTSVPFAVSIH